MNLAIITLSCARNYGAVLQSYALCRYLQDYGFHVELIDYITERYDLDAPDYIKKATQNHWLWGRNRFLRRIWCATYYRQDRKARGVFHGFLERYVPMTHPYRSEEELKSDLPHADTFIAGSDQIWNSDFSWDKKPDVSYFLDFVPREIPKISYASSFGKSALSEAETPAVRNLLEHFRARGVREESGRKIIERLGFSSAVVCDPTLLCGKNVWKSLAAERQISEPYLLLFQIRPDKNLLHIADAVAKRNSLKTVAVSPDLMHHLKIHRKVHYLPAVEEWISYFQYADFVITDSFHATVFSTIFEKPFLASTGANYYTRITDYLKRLGLSARVIQNEDLETAERLAAETIDYSSASAKLKSFVSESEKWLNEVLAFGNGGKR